MKMDLISCKPSSKHKFTVKKTTTQKRVVTSLMTPQSLHKQILYTSTLNGLSHPLPTRFLHNASSLTRRTPVCRLCNLIDRSHKRATNCTENGNPFIQAYQRQRQRWKDTKRDKQLDLILSGLSLACNQSFMWPGRKKEKLIETRAFRMFRQCVLSDCCVLHDFFVLPCLSWSCFSWRGFAVFVLASEGPSLGSTPFTPPVPSDGGEPGRDYICVEQGVLIFICFPVLCHHDQTV